MPLSRTAAVVLGSVFVTIGCSRSSDSDSANQATQSSTTSQPQDAASGDQTSPESGPSATADPLAGWTTLEVAGGVKVKVPTPPERRENVGVTSKGPTRSEEFRSRDERGRVFEVIVTTLPAAAVNQGPTPTDALKRFARARVMQRGSTPEEPKPIEGSVPILEQSFSWSGLGNEQVAVERHHLYGNTVVTLHAETTMEDRQADPTYTTTVGRFFAAFEPRLPAPAPETWQDPPFPDDPQQRALLEARIKNWQKFEEP